MPLLKRKVNPSKNPTTQIPPVKTGRFSPQMVKRLPGKIGVSDQKMQKTLLL